MPTDGAVDRGLLSPVTFGVADVVGDAAVLDALVAVEIALVRAWATLDVVPAVAVERVSARLGWRGAGAPASGHGLDVDEIAAAAVAGGNPVIPLVGRLRALVDDDDRPWVHRGATSQDILDSALMLIAHRAGVRILADLAATEGALRLLALEHRDHVAAARTLGQHAVPTTVGMRVATWLVGVRRARGRLSASLDTLPAQFGGAGGTLAAFVEHARPVHGVDAEAAAERLASAFAAELGLVTPEHPWHTVRWPITELGDALVQVMDALGVVATDVATLSRTEIGELTESAPGGSSAMPQKRNPVASVLVRSAALRAPQLGATLHTAAALAADERPDGAWHAEWTTLRDLLGVAIGAASTARRLSEGLTIDAAAVEKNLQHSAGLIVAERIAIVLGPVLGAERIRRILADATTADQLESALRAEPALASHDITSLLDPSTYTGLAGTFVDRVTVSGGQ